MANGCLVDFSSPLVAAWLAWVRAGAGEKSRAPISTLLTLAGEADWRFCSADIPLRLSPPQLPPHPHQWVDAAAPRNMSTTDVEFCRHFSCLSKLILEKCTNFLLLSGQVSEYWFPLVGNLSSSGKGGSSPQEIRLWGGLIGGGCVLPRGCFRWERLVLF